MAYQPNLETVIPIVYLRKSIRAGLHVSSLEEAGFEPSRPPGYGVIEEVRFAADSLLEQSGFELWVPPACDGPGSHKVRG